MKYLPICLLSLAVAGVFIYVEHQEKYVPAVILKGTASGLFVLVGYLSGKMNPSDMASMLVTGLLLGCVADILLNLRFVFASKGQLVFLVGILVFLGGHVAYLATILPHLSNKIFVFMIAAVMTGLLMYWIFQRITAKMAFKIFGVVYIGAIVALNVAGRYYLVTNPSAFSAVFEAGALLFLVSDIVLILNTFGSESRFSLRITNLSLYYLGQILIALSIQLIR